MMSVMVPFSSDSISSTGPGIGSCWHRCSARRICCRFCQMISASFSHLGGTGLSTHWGSAPCPIPPHWALTRSAAHPRCPRVGPRSPPAAADASTGSAHHPGWLFAACAAAAASSGASQPGPARWGNIRGPRTVSQGIMGTASWGTRQHHSPHGTAVVSGPHGAARPPAMPSSAAASSPATCAPGDPAGRAGRTGLGGHSMVLGLVLPAPQAHAPRPLTHLGGACSPGTG